MEESEFLITTIDNPYNPYTQYEDWGRFDEDMGYHTWQRIDKLMPTNYLRMSLTERDFHVEEAMNKLIKALPNIYTKVYKDKA